MTVWRWLLQQINRKAKVIQWLYQIGTWLFRISHKARPIRSRQRTNSWPITKLQAKTLIITSSRDHPKQLKTMGLSQTPKPWQQQGNNLNMLTRLCMLKSHIRMELKRKLMEWHHLWVEEVIPQVTETGILTEATQSCNGSTQVADSLQTTALTRPKCTRTSACHTHATRTV